jgi:FtsH-binding integral membrane protein
MSNANDFSIDYGYEKSESTSSARTTFIRRTYAHLAGAVLALVGIEAALLTIPGVDRQIMGVLGQSPWTFLIIFGAFIVFGTLAQYWAASQTSRTTQYIGLSVYVLLEAVILFPILCFTKWMGDPNLGGSLKYANIIPTAGILTLAVFAALTLVVFTTKKDFSFLGSALALCSFAAFGFIIVAIIFGISLGVFFCAAMIVLMGGYILYDTSNIIHHYNTDQYVAASLALFASVATLFFYILRLLLILASDRG